MANGIVIPTKEAIYTSNEQFIGYYGNNKMYRRVYEFGAVSANTDSVVLNDSTAFSGATIIQLDGVGYQSDGSVVTLGNYYGASSNCALWYNNSRIFVRTASAFTKGFFTVTYTK